MHTNVPEQELNVDDPSFTTPVQQKGSGQPISDSQFFIPDEYLPSLNPERSIIVHPMSNIANQQPLRRDRRPSRYASSPYVSRFGSEAG